MDTCQEHAETFMTLLTNVAHWEFELFLMLLIDGLALGMAWPFIRKHWGHHVKHDEAHPETATVTVVGNTQTFNKGCPFAGCTAPYPGPGHCHWPVGIETSEGEALALLRNLRESEDECDRMCGTDYPHKNNDHSS